MTEHSLEAIRNGDRTDLRRADLSDANLSGADLAWANLGGADLGGADLGGADLGGANFYDADLSGASLQDADLSKASLIDADLRRADLSGAKLSDADLHDAALDGADLPDYQRLPTDGQFVAYKGCRNHVVTLIVPDNADRASSLRGPKCRVEWAVVDEVMGPDGTPCEDTVAVSKHTSEFMYVEGKRVTPDEWDDNIRVECTHGIHVFPTKDEAMDWI